MQRTDKRDAEIMLIAERTKSSFKHSTIVPVTVVNLVKARINHLTADDSRDNFKSVY